MSGAISSLGIGSGVLTSDIIDQLKAADESRIIKPIENKITTNNQEQDAQELLTSLMKTFKASASALSYDTIFDEVTVSSSGAAKVEVSTGANVESFSLETVTLAKKEITTFGSFADTTSTPVASGSGTLSMGGYTINYDSTMTLEDLAQAITDTAGAGVDASILQTGTGAYTLVVSSTTTGTASALNVTDDSGLLDAGLAVTTTIQTAIDAEFKYNGITIARSTNEISDLIIGVDITLVTEGDISAITIEQDTNNITAELQQFTDSYNTLIQNLSDMTSKDDATGAIGIFNGESFIIGIKNELNKVITAIDSDNDSLVNYGIDISRSGTMSFNETTFLDKLNTDPDGVKLLFSGGVDSSGKDVTGWFENIDDKLKEYTGYGKLLSTFDTNLTSQGTSLSESYTKAVDSLDSRYEIMTKRFIAYDGMISRINAQFASMQMMISSSNNSNN